MTEIDFESYLRAFGYDERIAMKIGLKELLELYAADKVQLIDIRFHEEHASFSGSPLWRKL